MADAALAVVVVPPVFGFMHMSHSIVASVDCTKQGLHCWHICPGTLVGQTLHGQCVGLGLVLG